jgi:cytochrome c peroxidase
MVRALSSFPRAITIAGIVALAGCEEVATSADDDGGDSAAIDGGHMVPGLDAGLPTGEVVDGGYAWQLPRGFPRPPVPADNPMSVEKVELGRFLFYDERLSDNETFSCATCHKQELAFSDGRATGLGATGEAHSRGSMTLANVGYAPTLNWANPLVTDLEHQARTPIFGDRPVELGIPSIEALETRLRAVPGYAKLFQAAFPEDAQPVSANNLTRAISAFERTLISGDAPFDRWQNGDEGALSESAKRGHALFNSEKLECFHCHAGFAFTDHVTWEGKAFPDAPFHQTGLYNLDGRGKYPEPNTGVFETSLDARDMGKFKAPTLRNIALTAPYMHDGSIATLSEVLDHYANGGRAHSFRTDPLMIGFELDAQERADVIAFLESLTDQKFITDPRFSDPGPVD